MSFYLIKRKVKNAEANHEAQLLGSLAQNHMKKDKALCTDQITNLNVVLNLFN